MDLMHFIRPYWLLLLLPALLLCWRMWRIPALQGRWESVCDAHLLPYLELDNGKKRQSWRTWNLAVILLCAIVALSGPSWRKRDIPVFANTTPLVILFDLSGSMMAKDVAPSRLARAKFKIIDSLKSRKSGAAALLAFTQEPFVVTPLTEDFATISNLLPSLDPTIMPVQGYDLVPALQKAQQLIERAGSVRGDILVVSANGASLDAIAQAKQLAHKGIYTSVLGVGTPAGGPITLENGQLLKDSTGNVVNAHLDETQLQQLADSGSGRYVRIQSSNQDVEQLHSVLQRQGDAKITTNSAFLWQDDGHWFILAMLPWMLMMFRRGALA